MCVNNLPERVACETSQIRRKQSSLLQVLDAKRICFVKRDIAVSADDKREFRELMKDVNDDAASAMPPQIFHETHYCGVRVNGIYVYRLVRVLVGDMSL